MNSEAPKLPLVLIFMGVTGSGKTTVAKLFAEKTGAAFYEADDFHPPENIAKIRAGIPLTEAEHKKFLSALRKIVMSALRKRKISVLAYSALKAEYRNTLTAVDSRAQFVHLSGPRALIEERLKNRRWHFIPPALLGSQLTILEPPADALVFSCKKSPEIIIAELVHILHVGGSA